MRGWLQNLLAVVIGGALTGAATAAATGNLKAIGAAAGAGALCSLGHLNVEKNP